MHLQGLELLTAVALGLGLAAAVGFRVFVPALLAGLAARLGHVHLAAGFDWLSSDPALVGLGVAALLEIGSYLVPWLDHALDAAAAPLAVAAGTVLMASTLVEMEPWLRWGLALVAGGGTAGLIHGATAGLRLGSTATTGGLANPVLATVETGAATGLALLAIALPLVTLALIAFLVSRAVRLVLRRRRA
ncbi:MAG TPA: DUF4126 domain-containing protein [Candidatus Krumholzibacteria bacterium]|nr:DUF4126 domain-containing protein [Candidatus Krumholzibacteria bacterium]